MSRVQSRDEPSGPAHGRWEIGRTTGEGGREPGPGAIWEVVPIRLVTSHDLGGRFPPRKVRCVAFDLNMPNPFCATLAQTELNSC